MMRLLVAVCVTFLTLPAMAQLDVMNYSIVRDSIIARFNRDDFKGIYQLADTSFTKNISESRLVSYLKANRNSGNIIKIISREETRGGMTFHLASEVRDLNLFLKVTPELKFSSFGLSNAPIPLLDTAPDILSDNPLRTPIDKRIDSLVLPYFRNPFAAGVSIGLIINGSQLTYHYGVTDRETGTLPTSSTGYEIASITKTFTASLLAKAVLLGKASLDDDIRKFLPGSFPDLSYNQKPITLLDLANHTSRLPSLPPTLADQPGVNVLNPENSMDSTAFYEALRMFRPDTLPGYTFEYSNWGAALLGHILENIFQKSYSQLLHEYISQPLDMDHTTYQKKEKEMSEMATPYSENGNEIIYQTGGMFGPAGDIHSDLNDMMKYLKAQIEEKDAAIHMTHKLTRNNTGLGWGTRGTGPARDIQHNGSSVGFRSHLSAFPELGSGCVILANSKAELGALISGLQNLLKDDSL
jgi:CubicO group peptidase (beta-lactamase class C family)